MKMLERRYDIVTQDVKRSVAVKAISQRQSQILENIVFKTNVKMGGLNYTLALNESWLVNFLHSLNILFF